MKLHRFWAIPVVFATLVMGEGEKRPAFPEVAAILYKNCTSCHRPGEIGPMPLRTYQETRPWAKAIAEAVKTRRMPPWHAEPGYGHFSNDSRLKDAEIAVITEWVKAGAPEGDRGAVPPLPVFETGWRIGKPDAVFSIPEFTLGPQGTDEQQTIFVDTKLKEDTWVEAVELRPGNRRIVHHAHVWIEPAEREAGAAKPRGSGAPRVSFTLREGSRVYARPDAPVIDDGCSHPDGGMWPGARPQELASMLGSFVPGKAPETWPTGVAKRIPAGSRLKFTIHYSKTGKEEKDATSVGLRFAKRKPERELRRIDLHNTAFAIPPGAANHVVTACHTFNEDADVLSYVAHMHYRGKSMRFEATYPDGRTETLLNIPRYEFEWQTKYLNARPVRIPKGTRIRLTAAFDNSANNPSNPDPSKRVRWGDNTVDEMMDGWFEFVSP